MDDSPGLAGLAVAPAALTDAGRFADGLVTELDAIRRCWRAAAAAGAVAAGLREADDAIAETVARWDAELGRYVEALRALSVAFPAAATGYSDADTTSALTSTAPAEPGSHGSAGSGTSGATMCGTRAATRRGTRGVGGLGVPGKGVA